MPIEITMPRLSDTMEEGTLIKWRVAVGDTVEAGDHLADIETDKATMELQAFDDGVVAQIAIEEGKTVPVGDVIMRLAAEGESTDDAAAQSQQTDCKTTPDASQRAPETAPADPVAVAPADPGPDRVSITPVARKLAEQLGLDVARITGTGPSGRIIKRDVLAASDAATSPDQSPPAAPTTTPPPTPDSPALPTEAQTIPLSSRRKTIAARLVESKTTIPHFQVSCTASMDNLLQLRATLNSQLQEQQIKLSVNDFIARAAALACVEHPQVNSRWDQQQIIQHGTVNLGIAVSFIAEQGGGLVVPVVHDAQTKTLHQLSSQIKELATKARTTGLSIKEMTNGTFTITNLGMYKVDSFTAIINPPEAAILAVGSAKQKPIVRDGQIVVGHEMTATLSADHRVLDGAIAAQYLATFTNFLQNPATLLI